MPSREIEFFIAQGSPLTTPGGKVGGAEFVVLQQSTLLSSTRDVGLVCPFPETNGEPFHTPDSLRTQLYESPATASNDELVHELKKDDWLEYFHRALNGTDRGHVYGHYYVAGGVLAELGLSRDVVYMGHSWDRVIKSMDPTRKITSTREQAEASILRTANAIIVSTYAEQEALASHYSDILPLDEIINKTHVVPLGVDTSLYNPIEMGKRRTSAREQLLGRYGLDDPNNMVFYTLGRMSPQKAHLQAIQGFEELLQQDPTLNISLSIIGGPLEGKYFEEQVYPYWLGLDERIRDRVIFHDRQHAEVAHAAGDVFVGATTWETWFLSLTEAMAAGKPCLVSDKPILREVGGYNLPRVDERDPSTIARAMHRLATNKQYALEVAETAAIRGESYTWDASVAALTGVLDNLPNGG